MDPVKTPKVRFLLPEISEDYGLSQWVDMRSKFELNISKLVMPPPPRPPPQIKDPDVLLVELRRKLLAIDRTIKHKDVILEEDEPQETHVEKPDVPATSYASSENPTDQQERVWIKQTQPAEEQPTQEFAEEEPQPAPEKELEDRNSSNPSPNVGSKLPPRPPIKKPQTRRDSTHEENITTKRDDSLPKNFKIRRRSFKDFSKRQFQRALSAMNISHPHSLDKKLISSSTLQNDGKKIRFKSSSSSSLVISNLRSKFQRSPSNFYDRQKIGDISKPSNLPEKSMNKKSSWNKLFSSWSTNLQSCTRAQPDD